MEFTTGCTPPPNMLPTEEARHLLASVPGLLVSESVPLSRYTGFGIGGPAAILAETKVPEALAATVTIARTLGLPWVVLGGGTNLVVSDDGFPGIVARFRANRLECRGAAVSAEAGADLQALVDYSIGLGLRGLETMTGIPGWVGAAVYGNAGAYGRSVSDSLVRVQFFNGDGIRETDHAGCGFEYRESVFKRRKQWVILSAEFVLEEADPALLRKAAQEILVVRTSKYSPQMRCAGSIFKNLLLKDLPAEVASLVPDRLVKGGKVPSAFFLEQVDGKGLRRGGVRVADHHANLIYNEGGGTAKQLRDLIAELKERVRNRFGLELEEEIQYVGFPDGI